MLNHDDLTVEAQDAHDDLTVEAQDAQTQEDLVVDAQEDLTAEAQVVQEDLAASRGSGDSGGSNSIT